MNPYSRSRVQMEAPVKEKKSKKSLSVVEVLVLAILAVAAILLGNSIAGTIGAIIALGIIAIGSLLL